MTKATSAQINKLEQKSAKEILRETELLAYFNQLNEDGRKVALERMEELTALTQYTHAKIIPFTSRI